MIAEELAESAQLAARVAADAALREGLHRACQAVVRAIEGQGRVLTAGNGGSAADAAHLAEELTGRYRSNRPALAGLCLNACGATLTCIANDFGYDAVFSRQIEAHGRPGDVLVVFSTSGQSASILRALEAARLRHITTIGMLGKDGGPAAAVCNVPLVVPHHNTARIQEIHGIFLHLLCEAVERHLA